MKRIPPTLGPEKPAAGTDIAIPPRPAGRTPRRPRRGPWLLVLASLLLLPHAVVVALRWVPPPTSAFMLQSPVQPVRYNWVPREQIAEPARRAVVAAEDQKFWTHDGFDFEAIGKALEHNRRGGRTRGASTISQQVAKNLFMWDGRSWLRKGLEAYATVLIEWTWGKDRILEVYLNVAEFGPGLFGVEAASRQYFGKPAARLTPGEAARLAAVLPSPRKWRVLDPGPYVQSRVDWILGQMGHRRSAPEPGPEPEDEQEVAPAPGLANTTAASPPEPEPDADTELDGEARETGPAAETGQEADPDPEPAPAPDPETGPRNDSALSQ